VAHPVPTPPPYSRPPALAGPLGSVWQPHPPVAPKTYLPRAISAGDAARAGLAADRSTAGASVPMALLQTPPARNRFPPLTAAAPVRRRRRSPVPRSTAPTTPPPPPWRSCGCP